MTESTDTAKAPETAPEFDLGIERMILFDLGGQRYGLPIEMVQEIQQIVAFSEVPNGGGEIVGMVNLRGDVIPALDMRALVGLERVDYGLATPMIMCRLHDQVVALIVDEVEDVVSIPLGSLSRPPKLHALADRMLAVCRMDDGLVYLLDVENLVSPVTLVQGEGGDVSD